MSSDNWDQYSVIGDKGEVGFIDFADDQSVASYNPSEEGPVEVSVPFPFVCGKPQSVLVGKVAADSFTITNTTNEAVELWLSIYASNPEDSFQLSVMKPPSGQPDDVADEDYVGTCSMEDRILRPLETLTIWLSCRPKELGVYTSIVNIEYGAGRDERVVFLLAEDKVSRALASDKPYHRGRRKNAPFTVNSYVKGVRPSNPVKRPFKNKLALYPISQDGREDFANNQIPISVMNGLSRKNYVSYFKSLLIMEELRLEEDMKVYDMEAVSMKRGGRFLTLEVPGLAERRPSLVHGDAIFVRVVSTNPDDAPVYEGYIHRVEADAIYLQFADEFHQHHSEDHIYNVHFAYNRVNFRRLYQAIEAADALRANFLFPSDYDSMRRIRPSKFESISNLNEEQSRAVALIMGCKGGAPYVIHGPPGTGKTKTLVEVILQLYKTQPRSRLLVCASSNYAADHILETILNLGKEAVQIRDNDVFRLNAASRAYEDVGPDHVKYCFFEDLVFKCPPLDALLLYRIVVTTYMSASVLHAEGVKRGHFSHIVLDEAGQASEPETMVPIANFSNKYTVIVMAGDPKQLGPVINSKIAEENGLGKSYLERLFESDLYSKGDQNYVTMLVRNYRCHPEILSLPSKMFYDDLLIPAREFKDCLPWTDLLTNTEFPVLFFGIQGLDEREGSNPSWFNRIEASKVVEIINKLVAKDVGEQDIGVITPYRQQVTKIKTALECCGMADIKIGSVEQFQGQEREVIIVSTVRSTIKHNDSDLKFCLGFLSNPKRFNVAMTRARSLLVIIGNPHIISQDQYWVQMLWHCVDNNSYQGCGLPERKSSCPAYDAGLVEDGKESNGGAGSNWDGGAGSNWERGASSNWNDWGPEEANNNKIGGVRKSSCPAYYDGLVEDGKESNGGAYSNWDGGAGSNWDNWGSEEANNNKIGGERADENEEIGMGAWDPERAVAPSLMALSLEDEVGGTLSDSNEQPREDWYPDLPKPVKDEDEWSDGWKL